jgi:hypothetical protein
MFAPLEDHRLVPQAARNWCFHVFIGLPFSCWVGGLVELVLHPLYRQHAVLGSPAPGCPKSASALRLYLRARNGMEWIPSLALRLKDTVTPKS